MSTAKCHASGESLLSLCSKNSIGAHVSYYTERKKKETISACIKNRLYIKIM